MRIFALRSGQTRFDRLTPLGKEQISSTVLYLKNIGFNGIIYSAPYYSSLETASMISAAFDSDFTVLPVIREAFFTLSEAEAFVGLTADEIRADFERARIPSDFKYPWWESKHETAISVGARVREFLPDKVASLPDDCDVLLIGGEAPHIALREIYQPREFKAAEIFDASITLIDMNGESFVHSTDHIPIKNRTLGELSYDDAVCEFENSLSAAKEFFAKGRGVKLLHIGDTDTPLYPYFERLVKELSPDVIIHTGDLADQFKAGRVEAAMLSWMDAVPDFVNMMKTSCKELMIEPGNNDPIDKLSEIASGIRILGLNEIVEISGKKIAVCHRKEDIDFDITADIYLYGHAIRYERFSPTDNIHNGCRYFNAMWGVSLHLLDLGESLVLPKIKL